MKPLNNRNQPFNLQEALILFWQIKRQWNDCIPTGFGTPIYTVSKASAILRAIRENLKLPQQLRLQATSLQRDIVLGGSKPAKYSHDDQKVVNLR